MSAFDIQITDQQQAIELDGPLIRRAIEQVLVDAGKSEAVISLAVVDNEAIHELNRLHLKHDYATDVLSFIFEDGRNSTDGEVIVSAPMAVEIAGRLGAPSHDELLLYIIHGCLHLVGYDDKDDAARKQMIAQEAKTLEALGIPAPIERLTAIGFVAGSQGDAS